MQISVRMSEELSHISFTFIWKYCLVLLQNFLKCSTVPYHSSERHILAMEIFVETTLRSSTKPSEMTECTMNDPQIRAASQILLF